MKDDEIFLRAGRKLWPDQDPTGFGFFDFLHARGSPLVALFYSRLFWPDFVEFEGMVFLKETIEDEGDRDRVRKALAGYSGDRIKTEKSFNTVEVPSLFGRLASETLDEEDNLLAERICNLWRARLEVLFPTRRFSVEVLSSEESGGEVAIVFSGTR